MCMNAEKQCGLYYFRAGYYNLNGWKETKLDIGSAQALEGRPCARETCVAACTQ